MSVLRALVHGGLQVAGFTLAVVLLAGVAFGVVVATACAAALYGLALLITPDAPGAR